ncbi:hypothetical protein NDU88_001099 [Pleurodeles waltl]|uniref:Uncharacterized protein n=1 Tax=Pleurodeles waltl TaxID=8319 RepID=A0AAV7UV30_PLEWA|nr:hypothetical protein NDU88_001099 [Pleurodeles waltl]
MLDFKGVIQATRERKNGSRIRSLLCERSEETCALRLGKMKWLDRIERYMTIEWLAQLRKLTARSSRRGEEKREDRWEGQAGERDVDVEAEERDAEGEVEENDAEGEVKERDAEGEAEERDAKGEAEERDAEGEVEETDAEVRSQTEE